MALCMSPFPLSFFRASRIFLEQGFKIRIAQWIAREPRKSQNEGQALRAYKDIKVSFKRVPMIKLTWGGALPPPHPPSFGADARALGLGP